MYEQAATALQDAGFPRHEARSASGPPTIRRLRRPPRAEGRAVVTENVADFAAERDWLETLNTQAETTATGYRIMARHLTGLIGNVKLVELKMRDVDFALGKLAERLSTRSVRLARMILIQAIRNAMVNDLVVRNVADLCPQESQVGRLSHSTWTRLLPCYTHQLRPVTRTAAIALRPAVREQREDQWRPKLTVRLPRSLLPRKIGL